MSFNGAGEFFKQSEHDKLRDDYYFKRTAEEELRKDSPALQEAWDRYQVLLKLVDK